MRHIMAKSLAPTDSIRDYLAAQEKKSLLRFLTCGSVDDGKSTLIGRLLSDTKQIFEDQLAALERDGMLIMKDDDRMQLRPGEAIENRQVRFRTLGCYPLTGAIDSDADTLEAIVGEMLTARTSERQGRLIDRDEAGSMEKKKREGYF